MAQLGGTFDATTIPEDDNKFDPLPAGDYVVQVIDSDVAEKDGNTRLKLTLEVLDGPHQGRKLFDGLSVAHSNPTAQSIAQRQLADLILATGQTTITDTEELHFKPVLAKVTIRPAKGEYGPSNNLRYRNLQGQPPAAKAAAQPAQARPTSAAAPAAAAARPWAR